MLHNSDVVAALQNTLTIGFASAAIATGIGLLAAIGIDAMKKRSYSLTLGVKRALVAQMEDVEGGVRSYRIQRTTPDGLSYARDIAARYGLNLQEICQNAQGEKSSPEQKLCER